MKWSRSPAKCSRPCPLAGAAMWNASASWCVKSNCGWTHCEPNCAMRQISPANGFGWTGLPRSEEHTSELQSQSNLVCRLLLEKKKKKKQRSQLVAGLRDTKDVHVNLRPMTKGTSLGPAS